MHSLCSPIPAALLIALTALGPIDASTIELAASPPSGGSLFLALPAGTELEGYDWTHGSGTALALGQTFHTAEIVHLARVTVLIRAETEIGGEFVTLRVGRFSDARDATMDETLRIESALLPVDLPVGSALYLSFELDRPLELQADRTFGFVLSFAGGGGVEDARALMMHTGADLDPGGQAIEEAGSWSSALPNDLVVYLEAATDDSQPPTDSPDPDETLSLGDGRFRVDAWWSTSTGTSGYGQAMSLTPDSGCFWFFQEDNLEIFVKVLDACAISDRYWVFAAGLTNVEVRLRVIDRWTGRTVVYTNPQGTTFVPVTDTGSFSVCP